MFSRPVRPPEQVTAGPLVLRRVHADDAGAIAVAVGVSLEHLRPWMPWATPEAADLRSQLVRVAEADELWESGTGFIYVMIARDTGPPGPDAASMVSDPEGEFVGTIGLHLFYLLGDRNRLSAILNLSYRYLVWGHGGGVIVGDDPPEAVPGGPPQQVPEAGSPRIGRVP